MSYNELASVLLLDHTLVLVFLSGSKYSGGGRREEGEEEKGEGEEKAGQEETAWRKREEDPGQALPTSLLFGNSLR